MLGRNVFQRYWPALLFVALFLGPIHWTARVRSANLTSVTVRLSTPRLSFYGELDATNTVGSSQIAIEDNPALVAAGVTSTSSANLFEGDTVLIGDSQYKVASVSATNTFTITNLSSTPGINVLQATDADDADRVIATRSAALTVGFNTVSALADGSFRVLIPAASSNYNDSIPDINGWDYGSTLDAAVTVACPTNVTGYTFGSATANAGTVVLGGVTYHSFVCPYTGAGGNGTDFTVASNPLTISSLINPSPKNTHTEGFADTYKVLVQHLDGSDLVVDQTTVDVAVIESVRVTASVPPQITFRILPVASGQNRCGDATDVATTPTLVPLGELLIDSFKLAAQELVVSTNAQNGYAVTAIADNQLHRVGQACAGDATTGGCIPDSTGDPTDMSHTLASKWVSTNSKGFAYSLHDNSLDIADNGTGGTNDSVPFTHSSPTGAGRTNCDATSGGCWRQFADQEDGQAAQTIFSSTTVADSDSLYVCYKAVIAATQQAGTDYSTPVTYRATATF